MEIWENCWVYFDIAKVGEILDDVHDELKDDVGGAFNKRDILDRVHRRIDVAIEEVFRRYGWTK